MTISGQDSLTDARNLLWSAIEGYAPLSGVFQCKFKDEGAAPYFDGDTQAPDTNCLPAIAIWPSESNMGEWFENTNQLVRVRFDINMWTPGYELASTESKPERWAWLIREAIWRAGSGGSTDASTSFVKLGTCFYPQGFRASYRKVKGGYGGSQMLTLTTMTVVLQFKDDPRTTS